jgi:oligopeptide/dipeptide ABC transporter ATP-binding protein
MASRGLTATRENEDTVQGNVVLNVQGLKTQFQTEAGVVKAVDGIDFCIREGETFGVVGESGCGKSATALSILRLLPPNKGRVVEGHIWYHRNGVPLVDLAALDPRDPRIRAIRGREIALIFQEPMTSLNPVRTVGEQIVEAVRAHEQVKVREARERAVGMLARVGVSAPQERVDQYAHELSGGLRQRAMIAMALVCRPKLLLADEPTTALDVTIEAQILELIARLQADTRMAVMFITHDLRVIGDIAQRVIVMYAGKIVEEAATERLFYDPRHPYAQALLHSIPRIGLRKKLEPIRGSVPSLLNLPPGCAFAPRCPRAMEICTREDPPGFALGEGHRVRCWLYGEEGGAAAAAAGGASGRTSTTSSGPEPVRQPRGAPPRDAEDAV